MRWQWTIIRSSILVLALRCVKHILYDTSFPLNFALYGFDFEGARASKHVKVACKPTPFALEIAGGLRTFFVTWPSIVQNLILPNGGFEAFTISLSATYNESFGTQPRMLQMVHDIANKYHFYNTQLYVDNNMTRTCIFYNQTPSCTISSRLGNFAYQWEMVTRAHEALRGCVSEFFVRVRPDTLLLSKVNLSSVRYNLSESRKDAWIPCTSDRFALPDRAIDDVLMANRVGMDTYASKFPNNIVHRGSGLTCESYIWEIMKNISQFEVLLDYATLQPQFVHYFLSTGEFKSSSWTKSRCRRAKHEREPPVENYSSFIAFNMTQVEVF